MAEKKTTTRKPAAKKVAEKKPYTKPQKAEKAVVAPSDEIIHETVATPVEETETPVDVEAAQPATSGYTDEQVQRMIAEAVAKAVSDVKSAVQAQPTTIIREVSAETEKVYLLWQADVSDRNVETFGPNALYGTLTGRTGTIMIPKNEWAQFADEKNRRHLARRWLIVLSGLTDDERKMYGVDYKDGEIIDSGAFARLIDMVKESPDELLGLFEKLCVSHREMVARHIVDAYTNGDERVKSRELIVAMNKISKKDYTDLPDTDGRKRGMLYPIIEEMNAADEA